MGDFSLFDATCWYVVFLFSTVLHEASHAFTAYRLGDDTAYRAGQVSLDPIPHIRREPIGMVVVPILFYSMAGYLVGWASAPYNVEWARANPRRAATMAMAGPASNLLLLIIAALLIKLGISMGWFHLGSRPFGSTVAVANGEGLRHLCAVLLSIVFSLNLLLFVFNLFPVPPLDGSSIPLFFLNHEQSIRYSEFLRHPGFALIGVVIAYRAFPMVFQPVHRFFLELFF
jgi:Zn-dependent protease